MLNEKSEMTLAIFLVVVIVLILGVFVLAISMSFARRQKKMMAEKKQLQEDFQQTLLQTQLEIQEQTLRSISQEVHDNIGQVLSLASLNLETLHSGDEKKLQFTSELVNKALDDLRGLSKSLNPERVKHVGLTEAIQHELNQLERTGKFKTRFNIHEQLPDLSSDKTIILYRMIQETLNNIIKHSGASDVIVTVASEHNRSYISIADNGNGFSHEENSHAGIGLQNLQYRAALIGASTEIYSDPGKGTTVRFKL